MRFFYDYTRNPNNNNQKHVKVNVYHHFDCLHLCRGRRCGLRGCHQPRGQNVDPQAPRSRREGGRGRRGDDQEGAHPPGKREVHTTQERIRPPGQRTQPEDRPERTARQADRAEPPEPAARTGEQAPRQRPAEGADAEPAANPRTQEGGDGPDAARTERASGTDLGHELGGCQEHPDREHEGRGQDRSRRLHQRDDRRGEDDRHQRGQAHHRGVNPARGDRDGHRKRRDGIQHRERRGQGPHHRPRRPQHPCAGGRNRHRNHRRRHPRGHHPERVSTPCAAKSHVWPSTSS